jgi:hypothetical protein
MLLEPSAEQETAMGFQEKIDREAVAGSHAVDREGHGVDVAEHFGSGHIANGRTEPALGVSVQQSPSPYLQPFDARRGHGFRAQQKAREHLTVCERTGLEAEPRKSGLSLAHVGGNRPVEHHLATSETIREVRLVVARTAIPARKARRHIGHPVALDNLGHSGSIIKVTQ